MSLFDFKKLAKSALKKTVRSTVRSTINGKTSTSSSGPNVIDSIKSIIGSAGHQKPNIFKVTFHPPGKLVEKYGAQDMEVITSYCFSVGIPAVSFQTFDWVSKGVPIKLPYQKGFSDLTTNHYVDKAGICRSFIQDWSDLICNVSDNNYNYLSDYAGTIFIEQFTDGSAKESTAKWVIDKVYPTLIGQELLSFDANDALLTFDVTWAFNIVQLTGNK